MARIEPLGINQVDELLHELGLRIIWIGRTGIEIELRIVISYLLLRPITFIVIVKGFVPGALIIVGALLLLGQRGNSKHC